MTVGLLLITHEPLGSCLLGVAATIYGAQPTQAAALDVPNDAPREQVLDQAERLAATLDGGEGVLILTDIYGATPSRVAVALGERRARTRVLAGLSLPMLLRALTYAGLSLEGVTEKALAGGRTGICVCPGDTSEEQRP